MSSLLYNPWRTHIDFHHPWLYLCQCLRFCGWSHFRLRNFLPCVCLHYLCFTYCYSIALSSSDFSMNTKSTIVAFGPSWSLAHQLLLCLHKNSITYVPILYILWIIVYASCIFPLYDLPSSHFENDGDYNSDLIANNWIFSIPSCFVFFNSSFVSFFLQFCFLVLLLFVLIFLCFLFLCYFLWFFNRTLCIHAFVNAKTLKTFTISNNKQKQLSMITSFIFVLEHPTHHIHFFTYPLVFN
jgi:hypothetical protein